MATWLLVGGPRHGEEVAALDAPLLNCPVIGRPGESYKTARYTAIPIMFRSDGTETAERLLYAGIFVGYP